MLLFPSVFYSKIKKKNFRIFLRKVLIRAKIGVLFCDAKKNFSPCKKIFSPFYVENIVV